MSVFENTTSEIRQKLYPTLKPLLRGKKSKLNKLLTDVPVIVSKSKNATGSMVFKISGDFKSVCRANDVISNYLITISENIHTVLKKDIKNVTKAKAEPNLHIIEIEDEPNSNALVVEPDSKCQDQKRAIFKMHTTEIEVESKDHIIEIEDEPSPECNANVDETGSKCLLAKRETTSQGHCFEVENGIKCNEAASKCQAGFNEHAIEVGHVTETEREAKETNMKIIFKEKSNSDENQHVKEIDLYQTLVHDNWIDRTPSSMSKDNQLPEETSTQENCTSASDFCSSHTSETHTSVLGSTETDTCFLSFREIGKSLDAYSKFTNRYIPCFGFDKLLGHFLIQYQKKRGSRDYFNKGKCKFCAYSFPVQSKHTARRKLLDHWKKFHICLWCKETFGCQKILFEHLFTSTECLTNGSKFQRYYCLGSCIDTKRTSELPSCEKDICSKKQDSESQKLDSCSGPSKAKKKRKKKKN